MEHSDRHRKLERSPGTIPDWTAHSPMALGYNMLPGQEPRAWWIRDVQTGRSFAIEMPLDRATLRFEWHFGVVSERRTKLTQRIILSGSNAAAYSQQVEAGFGPTLASGMDKLAAELMAAEKAG